MLNKGTQILTLQGLRFDANLGILEHEIDNPQPIQVDTELNLGSQPLMPSDDDIHHVLDYRKVRNIIISECTAEHVNLLESLIGKLAHRLMQLPGVLGVRVKIAKLEIFEDPPTSKSNTKTTNSRNVCVAKWAKPSSTTT
jgi:dihydroneopterin aldolase